MIFGRDRVFLRWIRWLLRWDRRCRRWFHWQTANLWPLSEKGGVLLDTPNKNSYSTSYTASDDASANILSSTEMRFGLVPECWILRVVQFWGWCYIDCTLASVFDCIGRRRWKNLDRILCLIYFRFFSCVDNVLCSMLRECIRDSAWRIV